MTSLWIFKSYSVLVGPAVHRLARSPHNPPRPHGDTTPRTHRTAVGVPSERTGVTAKVGLRGAQVSALPETACSVPGNERVPVIGGFSIISAEGILLSGLFFVSPALGFHIYGRRFLFRGGTLSSPAPGIVFSTPSFFSAVKCSTLYAQVPGSSPTFRDFFFF